MNFLKSTVWRSGKTETVQRVLFPEGSSRAGTTKHTDAKAHGSVCINPPNTDWSYEPHILFQIRLNKPSVNPLKFNGESIFLAAEHSIHPHKSDFDVEGSLLKHD